MKNNCWTVTGKAMAVAALAVLLMSAGAARAGDTLEDFTLHTSGVNTALVGSTGGASVGLVDPPGMTYDWGGFNSVSSIRLNSVNGMQFGSATTQGAYFLTRFSSGGGAVVDPLQSIEVTENQTDFSARLLVRNHGTGDWYASEPVALANTVTVVVATIQWAPVTNAAAAIEDAINIPQAFAALTLGSLAAWPTGMAIDGGGVYNDSTAGAATRITRISWTAGSSSVADWEAY